jgi:hypothetical protein
LRERAFGFVGGALLLCLAGAAAGCSVEGSQALGEECLMSRECVAPLRCEVTAEGVSRCAAPVRLDAAALAVDAASEAGPGDARPADAGP